MAAGLDSCCRQGELRSYRVNADEQCKLDVSCMHLSCELETTLPQLWLLMTVIATTMMLAMQVANAPVLLYLHKQAFGAIIPAGVGLE